MYTVAVLMSTYNGEKYIREQIESILGQYGVNVLLYIRDDGSSDTTIKIIQEYNKPNIKLIVGENLGIGNSFMELVYQADDAIDYYAFADQDDVWLPEKLYKAIEKIGTQDDPILYVSNQILVDKALNKIGIRYQEEPDLTYKQIICQNKATGCTMLWNEALQKILKDEKRRPSKKLLNCRIHDVWVAMVASVVGKIKYDSNSYILYRQHDNNIVGIRHTNLAINFIKKLLNPQDRNGRSKLCIEIYNKLFDYIRNESIKNYIKCVATYKTDIKSKKKLLTEFSMIQHTQECKYIYIIKLILNLI